MEIIIQRLLSYFLAQLVAALIASGFTFGFGAFLCLLCGAGLLAWCYWRVVLCRPRVQVCGVFVGEYLGQSYYMEGL